MPLNGGRASRLHESGLAARRLPARQVMRATGSRALIHAAAQDVHNTLMRNSGVNTVLRRGWLLPALVLFIGCQRDPGRDVTPMTNPLGGGATEVASSEIIPLEEVRKSQAAAVSQRVANTEITLTYSRPVARGRALFGSLVPYDEVWNPGADQATAIAFTRDVQVNGQPLPAGKYSLWVIPRAEDWTIIFNRAADVYHTPYPGEAQDALRLTIRPERGPHMEALAFYFPTVEGKETELRMHWGDVMVPLSVRVP